MRQIHWSLNHQVVGLHQINESECKTGFHNGKFFSYTFIINLPKTWAHQTSIWAWKLLEHALYSGGILTIKCQYPPNSHTHNHQQYCNFAVNLRKKWCRLLKKSHPKTIVTDIRSNHKGRWGVRVRVGGLTKIIRRFMV